MNLNGSLSSVPKCYICFLFLSTVSAVGHIRALFTESQLYEMDY